MKKSKKQYSFILIIFLSLFAISTQVVSASSISFGAPSLVNIEENFSVVVNTDTEEILINSIELSIDYDENLLIFNGYSDDNAVVKFWIDPPHAEQGKINLSGIIPGGVLGLYDAKKKGLSPTPLVHLFFTAKETGVAEFSFTNSKILKHDGFGTPLIHEQKSTDITITNDKNIAKVEQKNIKKDTEKENLPTQSNSFDYLFWLVIFIIVSGIVVYKLLKYKHEK